MRAALTVVVFAVLAPFTSACGGNGSGDPELDAAIDARNLGDARADAPGIDATSVDAPDVAASLTGLRWELPCLSEATDFVCITNTPATVLTSTVGGNPGVTYDVELRFRGVVEERSYVDGTADGNWYVGGAPAPEGYDLYNVYKLEISDPPAFYFINSGISGNSYVGAIDYTRTIAATAGAIVTLTGDPYDDAEIKNRGFETTEPVIPPDVPPAPAAYDGQFVQMDVVSVTARP